MSTSHHLAHVGSWGGTLLAFKGFISGQDLQTYLGVATAFACSAVCSYGYFKGVMIFWQNKWQRARDDFRREQELLDAQNRARIEKIERGDIAAPVN